jgi:hypothetical protein
VKGNERGAKKASEGKREKKKKKHRHWGEKRREKKRRALVAAVFFSSAALPSFFVLVSLLFQKKRNKRNERARTTTFLALVSLFLFLFLCPEQRLAFSSFPPTAPFISFSSFFGGERKWGCLGGVWEKDELRGGAEGKKEKEEASRVVHASRTRPSSLRLHFFFHLQIIWRAKNTRSLTKRETTAWRLRLVVCCRLPSRLRVSFFQRWGLFFLIPNPKHTTHALESRGAARAKQKRELRKSDGSKSHAHAKNTIDVAPFFFFVGSSCAQTRAHTEKTGRGRNSSSDH